MSLVCYHPYPPLPSPSEQIKPSPKGTTGLETLTSANLTPEASTAFYDEVVLVAASANSGTTSSSSSTHMDAFSDTPSHGIGVASQGSAPSPGTYARPRYDVSPHRSS